MSSQENVIRIPPNKYIHVLDNNTNISRLEIGPATFIRKEHESVIDGPTAMINLPPRTYCQIQDPIIRKDGKPVLTPFGQVKNNLGEIEYRIADNYPDPFPLFPGESLVGKIEKLLVVQQNTAVRLAAIRDFEDGGVKRIAGSEWQKKGPFTYYPRIEESVIGIIKAEVKSFYFYLK
jgi:major vault protein